MLSISDAGARLRAAFLARLHPDWRRILRHAWSVRFLALATVLEGLEFVFAAFTDDPPIARGTFAALGFLVTVGAGLARFVAQSKVSGDDA